MSDVTESISTLTIIDPITCNAEGCGLVFGMDRDFIAARREDHATWYCPNGHKRYWPGPGKEERLERDLERERRFRANAEENTRIARAEAETERRRAAAYKGHLTRQRRLMTNGVCPHPGCRRNFLNVKQHMRNQHPELLAELEEATK